MPFHASKLDSHKLRVDHGLLWALNIELLIFQEQRKVWICPISQLELFVEKIKNKKTLSIYWQLDQSERKWGDAQLYYLIEENSSETVEQLSKIYNWDYTGKRDPRCQFIENYYKGLRGK